MASTHSDQQPGGLTTVVNRVIRATRAHVSWTWLVRLDQPHGAPTEYWLRNQEGRRRSLDAEVRTITPARASDPILRRVGWTIFQPGGGTIAPALYGASIRRSVRRQVPHASEHLHWVGTGIELLGFELLRHARRVGVPFTVCPAIHPFLWGDAEIDASLYRKADGILVLSQDERALLEHLGVAPEHISLVPLGPTVAPGGDGRRFRREHDIAVDDVIVTFMARRSKHKGLLAVVEAARTLRERGRRFVLAVAGPPGDVPGLDPEPWLLDLGLCEEHVKADLLAATSVFSVPSISESLGIVYLDAWSAAVPVVAGRAPAVLELVDEGVDGFCVTHDPEQIADAVGRLLDDPELARKMGQAGQRKQQERYTWERSAQTHLEAFRSAGRVHDSRGSR